MVLALALLAAERHGIKATKIFGDDTASSTITTNFGVSPYFKAKTLQLADESKRVTTVLSLNDQNDSH